MKAILFSSLLLAACAAEGSRSAPTTEPWEPYFGPNDDVDEQGRFLLGNFVDKLTSGNRHFWVGSTAVRTIVVPLVGPVIIPVPLGVSGDRLVHDDGTEITDEQLVGLEFPTGTRRLKIIAVGTDAAGATGYELSYFDGTSWQPYCDSSIDAYAVPMQGSWTLDRDHIDGATLSFACKQSGVGAKCIDWGYSPGTGGPTDSAWRQHRTCVQLAAADYCNLGIPRTRELTPIVIRDFVTDAKPHPTEEPTLPVLEPTETWPPPDDYYVEAAWQYDGPAMCLSKLRWASLPRGGFCPTVLPDPRDPENHGAEFCDDVSLEDLEKRGARLLSASKMMDVFAYPWRNDKGELLTSVDGYVEDNIPYSAPFEDTESYDLATPTPSYILLRNLPGSVALSEVTPLYQQQNSNTGDRVVAPLDPITGGVTAGHVVDTKSRPEGYMFNKWRPGLGTNQPLMLFEKGGDYVTALTQPPNYTFVKNLGWVMAP